jgi:gluconate 2-dehydrogenase gamma chain
MSNENADLIPAAPDSETDDGVPATKEMSRREAVQLMSVLPIAAALGLSKVDHEKAWRFVEETRDLAAEGVTVAPKFFTPAEFRTVRVLSDMIIPRDDRSGSATDAGVPEFMDFIMIDKPENQKWMRAGLTWIDAQSTTRFGKSFADAGVAQREQILNDVAWPARAPATVSDGVSFFNRFRDLTSSGFWTSKMGIKDLRYLGNTFNPNWNGCPPEALAKLGVTYAKFDPRNIRLTPQ